MICLAFDVNESLVVLNNTVNHSQTEPCALTESFGGEKGFKDP
jgi:hypothetical protein